MKKAKYEAGQGLKEMVADGPAYSKNPDLSKLVSKFKTPKGTRLKKIAQVGLRPNGITPHTKRATHVGHSRRGAVD